MPLNKGYLTAKTDKASDETYTPAYAIKPLVKYVQDYMKRNNKEALTIWCPFDLANSKYVEELRKDYDSYACEMEGAAAAVVCIRFDTPFVVLRALSDKADGKAHDSYENFGKIAADNSSRIVIKMLDYIGKMNVNQEIEWTV